ncbi:probable 18S rRNA (guanine-N(7))-methyltransferase isoform X1 [Portunus trituberculatus]|uniref:probable 18S rRNA (guanine-N(7))-methyltransferase isoform X1 n=1 Tax=Portunus trituberculatus TaxID=210409 RepID=UPI001E1D078E|nr:probable 18S rRNA (guanine-N(7))-methyltransferase isoform X1 [Portunus trituberculatus]
MGFSLDYCLRPCDLVITTITCFCQDAQTTRIIEVQEKCTERALELLALPPDISAMLLDLGCGSGLSGEAITENGHYWVGMDISPSMLDVALEREVEGDMLLGDIGTGVPFRPGMFDGAISISAIQWLCYADSATHRPAKRLYKLFMTLFASLSRGSRAVFQFYPENDAQVEMVVSQAMRAGFTGGLVVDFPNSTKAKKIYLVLMTGGAAPLPSGLQEEGAAGSTQALYQRRERMKQMRGSRQPKKAWIMQKKERRRKQGRDVRPNSKYTGRRRPERF